MPAAGQDQTLNAIMTAESGGRNVYNYMHASNPNLYTASGYFQITNTTWREIAPKAGVDISQYPTAISAPYDVQRQAAGQLLSERGTSPWNASASRWGPMLDGTSGQNIAAGPIDGGQPNQNPETLDPGTYGGEYAVGTQGYGSPSTGGFQNAGFQVNPYGGSETIYQQTPNSSGQTATGITSFGGNSAASAEGSAPGYLPPILTGGPFALGLTPGLSEAVGSWLGTLESGVTSIVTGAETAVGNAFKAAFGSWLQELEQLGLRALLVIVGVILIGLALWHMLSQATGGRSGSGSAAGRIKVVPIPL